MPWPRQLKSSSHHHDLGSSWRLGEEHLTLQNSSGLTTHNPSKFSNKLIVKLRTLHGDEEDGQKAAPQHCDGD